jgi:TaqI-like C-terminal specificity domain
LQATFATELFLTNQSVQSLILKDTTPPLFSLLYLLGILNSRLLSWFFRNVNSVARRDDFPKIIIQQTRDMPVRAIAFDDRADKSRYDRMVQLVEHMLTLHKQLASAKAPHDKTVLQTQIDAADRQIDRLVYDLYGLTDEEIQIVEGVAQ